MRIVEMIKKYFQIKKMNIIYNLKAMKMQLLKNKILLKNNQWE
jgi:hypothetical protein